MRALPELLGQSAPIVALREQVVRLVERQKTAQRLPPVLIQGETGVGKGLLARAIHNAGSRRQRLFVDISCAALPATLVEMELFGYERGAFTDARRSKPGLFQVAHGGTLFLDEIAAIPPELQAKLLKAIEERQVRRLGGTRGEDVDVWMVSAANEDLRAAVAAGRFREDLYHRLAAITLWLPPLRERAQDIILLAEHFLTRACVDYKLEPKRLADSASEALLAYGWPGNVRELANVIERVALVNEVSLITANLLDLPAAPPASARPVVPRPRAPSVVDESAHGREELLRVLEDTNWNVSQAAGRLRISRNTLRYRMEKYGVGPRRVSSLSAEEESQRPQAPVAIPLPPILPLRWERRLITMLRVALTPPPTIEPVQLAPLIEDLLQKVRTFGAAVEELAPLGVVAAFGVEPTEDAPTRAVHAGLAIVKALERAQDKYLGGLACRLAIHVQQSLIGRGASITGMDPIERCQLREALDALVEAIEPGGIAVSAAASEFLERRFALEPLERGEGGYRLAGGGRSGFELKGRALNPFVGRERELAAIRDLLVRAESSRGQVVGIVGEPGVGKSRLLYEFYQGIERGRVTYLKGDCHSYGDMIPYLPIIDIVRANFGLAEFDSPLATAEKVRDGLKLIDLDPELWTPYLLHLLGSKEGTEALAAQSPAAIKARTMEALRHMGLSGSRQRAIVFAVEDLQWIDQTSEGALASLADALSGCRILLLATYRPGYRPPWSGRSYFTQLVLDPLTRSESLRVVQAALQRSSIASGQTETIVDRGQGIPFFLEELARVVAEHADPHSEVVLPNTIQGVLTARVDRLPAEDKHLLQTASVIGRDVNVPILQAVTDLPELAVRERLVHLQSAEFLHEAGVSRVGEYTFKHVLTHQATYQSLLQDQKRALHRRVAEALERLSPDMGERRPEILAHHYSEAGRPREAVGYWLRAGEHAIRCSANAEAIAHITRGLTLLGALPEGPERTRHELVLRLTLCTALVAHHGYAAPEVESTLSRVRELTDELGEAPELPYAYFGLWRFSLSRADFAAAEELAARLLAAGEGCDDPERLAPGHVAAGITAFYLGDLHRAREHLARVAAHHDPTHGRRQAVLYGQDLGVGALGYLGWTLTLMGQFDRGARAVDRSLDLAREGGHRFTLALALLSAGLVYAARRDPAAVVERAGELIALSQEQGFEFFAALALGLSGWARFALGDGTHGVALMREGSERYRAAHQRIALRHRAELAEALLETGAIEEACTILDEAIAHSRATRERALLSEVQRIKGEALWQQSPADPAAATLLHQAITTALEQGANLLALRAATSLVRFERDCGAQAAGETTLRDLYGCFTEGFDLSDLAAARALLSAGPSAVSSATSEGGTR